jgi:hypothetical protein
VDTTHVLRTGSALVAPRWWTDGAAVVESRVPRLIGGRFKEAFAVRRSDSQSRRKRALRAPEGEIWARSPRTSSWANLFRPFLNGSRASHARTGLEARPHIHVIRRGRGAPHVIMRGGVPKSHRKPIQNLVLRTSARAWKPVPTCDTSPHGLTWVILRRCELTLVLSESTG